MRPKWALLYIGSYTENGNYVHIEYAFLRSLEGGSLPQHGQHSRMPISSNPDSITEDDR
jgi:hypothetical protein